MMKQYQRGRTTRTVFESPYESTLWLAEQNDTWLEHKAAARLYREAAAIAPNEEARAACIRNAEEQERPR